MSTHLVFRPENTTSAHTPLPQVARSRVSQYVVSRHYNTALRETSQATVPGERAARHTCSALLAQAAHRFPSVRRFTQASPVTATGDLPCTRRLCRRQLERSPAEAFALRRMRSSSLAERRRPGPVTAVEPIGQNPPLPQVPACRDSHSMGSTTIATTATTTATTINNNYSSCCYYYYYYYHYYYFSYFERKVAAPA
jgi:hypothetical protein